MAQYGVVYASPGLKAIFYHREHRGHREKKIATEGKYEFIKQVGSFSVAIL
ncbi:MAG: hypothetical protein ACI8Z9_001763 [Paraglaciecola sp.]|jgi:hypothetical protein